MFCSSFQLRHELSITVQADISGIIFCSSFRVIKSLIYADNFLRSSIKFNFVQQFGAGFHKNLNSVFAHKLCSNLGLGANRLRIRPKSEQGHKGVWRSCRFSAGLRNPKYLNKIKASHTNQLHESHKAIRTGNNISHQNSAKPACIIRIENRNKSCNIINLYKSRN